MSYVLNITKNGNIISTEDTEGIRINLRSIYDEDGNICSLKSCMGYLGDDDFMLAIYNITVLVVIKGRLRGRLRNGGLDDKDLPYKRKSVVRQYGDVTLKVKRISSNLYKLRFVSKGYIYEAVYGYE